MKVNGSNVLGNIIGSKKSIICRICGLEEGVMQSIQNYEESVNLTFAEIVKKISSIEIYKNDGLSQFICTLCCSEALSAYSFLLKVQCTEVLLKSCVNHIFQEIKNTEFVENSNENILRIKFYIESLNESQTFINVNEVLNCPEMKKCYSNQSQEMLDSKLFEEMVKPLNDDDVIVIVKEDIHKNTKIKRKNNKQKSMKYMFNLKSSNNVDSMNLHCMACPVCKKEYNSIKMLKLHFKNHKNVLYTCHKCLLVFKNIMEKKLHKRQVHSRDGYNKMCDVCGKLLRSDTSFQLHMANVHSSSNIYVCDYCSKIFRGRLSFETHILQHECDNGNLGSEQSRNVQFCEQCGAKFINKDFLKRHLELKHDSLKRFQCDICNKLCRTKTVKTHMRIHKGEKSVHCELCGRGLVDNRALIDHMLRHKGERPFVCHLCGSAFVTLSSVNTHYKVAHTKPTIPCSEPGCPALFHLRCRLNAHYKKVHLKPNKRRRRSKPKHVLSAQDERYVLSPDSQQIEKPLSYATVNASHFGSSFGDQVLRKLPLL